MEPGEGSAAPKATVALPGTDVKLAGRAPARLAVHCSLATGGPGAATRHAPFGRPRRPLGTFPRGESTSSARRRAKPPTRNRFLVEGRKRAYLSFYRITKAFASAEATRGLSDRPLDPFGAHPCMSGRNIPQETKFLRKAGKGLTFLFAHRKGFRLCGGDHRAFRSPFGNLRPLAATGNLYNHKRDRTPQALRLRRSVSLYLFGHNPLARK